MRHRRQVWGATPTNPLLLNEDRVRQLQQLCHPDRHAGSVLSVKVSQWLVDCGKELDAKHRLNA